MPSVTRDKKNLRFFRDVVWREVLRLSRNAIAE